MNMKPVRKGRSLILILGALTTVTPFSIDMYLPAFQQIADHFRTSVARVSFSLSSYFIGVALGQLFYGPLLDRFGRRRPLICGLILYVLASLACAFSPTVESLIGLRFVQAIGGCVASVASVAMVRDFYGHRESARLFSKLMLILSVSPLFAPTVGSLVSAAFGWSSVFLFLSVIVLAILLVVLFGLPEGHEPDTSISLRPRAIVTEYVSILCTRQFFAYAVAASFSFGGLFAYLAASPAIFLKTFGLSERMFGAIFALLSIGVVGGGQVNVQLMRLFSSVQIFRAALVSQGVIALVFVIGASLGDWGLGAHIFLFFVYLACVGLTFPNATAIALEPFEKNSGSASALLSSLQMGVGALAAGVFGLLTLPASLAVGIVFALSAICGWLVYFSVPVRLSEEQLKAAADSGEFLH